MCQSKARPRWPQRAAVPALRLRPLRHLPAAHALAISLAAPCIEPDVMMSSHGVAIVMHSFDTSETTDAASRSEFASRRRTFQRDGLDFAGCSTLTLAAPQLRSPRPRQRCSCALFPVLVLVDAIATARSTRLGDATARPRGSASRATCRRCSSDSARPLHASSRTLCQRAGCKVAPRLSPPCPLRFNRLTLPPSLAFAASRPGLWCSRLGSPARSPRWQRCSCARPCRSPLFRREQRLLRTTERKSLLRGCGCVEMLQWMQCLLSAPSTRPACGPN